MHFNKEQLTRTLEKLDSELAGVITNYNCKVEHAGVRRAALQEVVADLNWMHIALRRALRTAQDIPNAERPKSRGSYRIKPP